MRKIIAVMVAMAFAVSAFAQNGRSIYEKYSDKRGVSAVYISPSMFKLIGRLPDVDLEGADRDDVNLSSVVRNLTGFYVLEVENRFVREELYADVSRFVKSGNYALLLEAKEEDSVTKIYEVRQKDTIKSLVLLNYDDDEVSFICLDGDMDAAELDAILSRALR